MSEQRLKKIQILDAKDRTSRGIVYYAGLMENAMTRIVYSDTDPSVPHVISLTYNVCFSLQENAVI